MGDTSIEWTDKSWNPIAAYYEGKRGWMCSKPSAGCKNCYSERLNLRLGNKLLYTAENAAKVEWRLVNLDEPAKWKKPQKCFVESMGDLFHELIPDEMIGWIWSKMLEFPQHTFQVLTKRTGRMRELVTRFAKDAEAKGLRSADHIWLGTSVENQEQADKRIPELLKIPAKVRFLSCEPLLGHIDLWGFDEEAEVMRGVGIIESGGVTPSTPDSPPENYDDSYAGIDWVIVGGESGPGARPMHPDWARSLRDQCQVAGVAFHFKQYGEWVTESGIGATKLQPMNLQTMKVLDGRLAGQAFAVGYFEDQLPLLRVGKKAAGRVLDGRTWDELPQFAIA
jgi:protein gp37